jgi:C-terminal processing protease CtpA/Prc
MQKIIKWIFTLLLLGVSIFIILFLIEINSPEKLAEIEPLALKNEVIQKKSKDVWLNHFSKNEKTGYFYPVNEVYVKVDLDEKIINTITYKLSASLLDPYQTFCLKEELKHYDLKYYLQKDKKNVELLIFSENIDKLNSLVKVLKNYQISATIAPYKKDLI